ncbi:guanylate kinase [Schaalia vaccimaxillae]|uniref:guanylate kinase n=1 Tax=Schaalia vaccimaxillae TaxID=183916 RepID=UPI0003B4C666|nr:guanylate kinase [Schaalia vaccimaxillae]
MDIPRLTVLAGPTAVGKGTVVALLRQRHPELVVSISATTRSPRPGEIDGVHYYFVSDSQFDDLISSGNMLEWATVHGRHRYGTPRPPVDEALDAGKSVLLEIDLSGARQVRQSRPDARFVFLAPPSWDCLVDRLVSRGTEDEAERSRRLETARIEMQAESEFDTTVINDDLKTTVSELARVMGLE